MSRTISRTLGVPLAALPLIASLLAATAFVPSGAAPGAARGGGQLSGAIFTTDASGVPVNLNHYDSKPEVHLNGGPGINAPDNAAGLPAGTYSFQVTNPNGKVLLSEDDVSCRRFTVDDSGIIQAVVAGAACTTGAHGSGTDLEDLGVTAQLIPFADTPNPGGVYKVWVTPTSRLDCNGRGNRNCFVPRYSKTDNFKVRADAIVEIDTRFWKPGHDQALLGMAAGWTDTNGASNVKFSEYDPSMLAFREAHVEAVEEGTHEITLGNQPGCTIDHVVGSRGEVYSNGRDRYRVPVTVAPWTSGADVTYRVEVYCE